MQARSTRVRWHHAAVAAIAVLLVAASKAPAQFPPLVTYNNPTYISGESFGRFAYSNGVYAFISDSSAAEVEGVTGAVYQFELSTGALIRTFGSPEGANETNFGDKDAISTLGDNLLVGDWGAQRVFFPDGRVYYGGLAYRFSISTGAHLETYSPVERPPFWGGTYGLAIIGVNDLVIVGWPRNGALEVFNASGGFGARYTLFPQTRGSTPLKALGPYVVSGSGTDTNQDRYAYVVNPTNGQIVVSMLDPRPCCGGQGSSLFGTAVATNAAGTRILVGAYRSNAAGGCGSPGAAYLYDASGDLLRTIDAPSDACGFFGWDVEFLGEDLLIGAPAYNGNRGTVCLFDGATGAMIRKYDGYYGGLMFGYSLGAVDAARFLVGTNGNVAYLMARQWPPGDLDGDGDVDLTDLAALLANYGCAGGGCAGDVDGDGDTDLSDLAILLAHYGEGP